MKKSTFINRISRTDAWKEQEGFSLDHYMEIHRLTGVAIRNVLRQIQALKELPKTTLGGNGRPVDHRVSQAPTEVEGSALASEIRSFIRCYLEAKAIYLISGRRGEYRTYIDHMIKYGVEDVYDDIGDLGYPLNETVVEAVYASFDTIHKMTPGTEPFTSDDDEEVVDAIFQALKDVISRVFKNPNAPQN